MKTVFITASILLLSVFNAHSLDNQKGKFDELKIEYTKTDVSCFGKTDGKISINVTGGKAPYIIVWENGLYDLELENLRTGDFSVKVCDARGETIEESIRIEAPSALHLAMNVENETIIDALGGSMNAKISGGSPWEVENTAYYFIRLNDQANFEDPRSLEDGAYTLSVEDANGCVFKKEVQIDFTLESSKFCSIDFTDVDQSVLRISIFDTYFMPEEDMSTANVE